MSHIYLIRHGQASFGAENYDKLSPLGQQQARIIGDYFASQGTQIEQVVHGEMSRQQQTAEILAERAGFARKLVCLPGANEFDSDSLIRHYLPILAKRSVELNRILENGENWWAAADNFELFFRAVVSLWQADTNCPFESWNAFQLRCMQCLNDVVALQNQAPKTDPAQKKNVMVLATSGGLISVIMQSILGFDHATFMDMNLTTNNASITEVIWAAGENAQQPLLKNKSRLLSFNNITPLMLAKKAQLITRK